jgi:hypothetical protein
MIEILKDVAVQQTDKVIYVGLGDKPVHRTSDPHPATAYVATGPGRKQ